MISFCTTSTLYEERERKGHCDENILIVYTYRVDERVLKINSVILFEMRCAYKVSARLAEEVRTSRDCDEDRYSLRP